MKEIIFPAINLKIITNPIALNIINISITWYAIIIVLAIIISMILMKIEDGKYSIKFDDILELAIFLIPISLICARLYYVIFNFTYYARNLNQILNIKSGGLAIYGGILGGLLVTIIYSKFKKINILDILDYIVPYLALRSINWKVGKLYKL